MRTALEVLRKETDLSGLRDELNASEQKFVELEATTRQVVQALQEKYQHSLKSSKMQWEEKERLLHSSVKDAEMMAEKMGERIVLLEEENESLLLRCEEQQSQSAHKDLHISNLVKDIEALSSTVHVSGRSHRRHLPDGKTNASVLTSSRTTHTSHSDDRMHLNLNLQPFAAVPLDELESAHLHAIAEYNEKVTPSQRPVETEDIGELFAYIKQLEMAIRERMAEEEADVNDSDTVSVTVHANEPPATLAVTGKAQDGNHPVIPV